MKRQEIPIPTPFGIVRVPIPAPPVLAPPEIDERRGTALMHAIAVDLSGFVGLIPVVGDILADVVEDLHGAELRRILTPEEYDRYLIEDKVAPSGLAIVRTFMKVKLKE